MGAAVDILKVIDKDDGSVFSQDYTWITIK